MSFIKRSKRYRSPSARRLKKRIRKEESFISKNQKKRRNKIMLHGIQSLMSTRSPIVEGVDEVSVVH